MAFKIQKFYKKLFYRECKHTAAHIGNCRYCPDCGKHIEAKWVTIKCDGCGHYRKPIIDKSGKTKAANKYCFYCGSIKFSLQNYYETNIPDRMKAISLKKIEAIKDYSFGSLTEKTKIWISKPDYAKKTK